MIGFRDRFYDQVTPATAQSSEGEKSSGRSKKRGPKSKQAE